MLNPSQRTNKAEKQYQGVTPHIKSRGVSVVTWVQNKNYHIHNFTETRFGSWGIDNYNHVTRDLIFLMKKKMKHMKFNF